VGDFKCDVEASDYELLKEFIASHPKNTVAKDWLLKFNNGNHGVPNKKTKK
jgi:hypothetical protein